MHAPLRSLVILIAIDLIGMWVTYGFLCSYCQFYQQKSSYCQYIVINFIPCHI